MGWRKYTSICGNGKAFGTLIRELGQKQQFIGERRSDVRVMNE